MCGFGLVSNLGLPPTLAAGGKKVAQHFAAGGLGDAGVKLGPVVAGWLVKNARPVLDAAALGIGGAEIEAADTRQRHRLGTHRARFEGHIQVAAAEPLAGERLRRLPFTLEA